MNIKTSFFYAALAACLGTGYVGGTAVSQRDIDRLSMPGAAFAQCGETEDDRRFNSTSPKSSPAKGY
jgi:hypothetical protein